jgi:adenylate kinase family enzyme
MIHFDNPEKLRNTQKIAIIGCAGSGKTYLTCKLAEKLHLPVYHLDQYHWKENWQRVDEQVFTDTHRALCEQDRWIIEGIYFRHLPERIEHCDAVIFLDMPRSVCLWHVIKRSIFNHGQVMQGNPHGCEQNIFSLKFVEFLSWIWNFNKKHRATILQTLQACQDRKQVYVISSIAQMNNFIERL